MTNQEILDYLNQYRNAGNHIHREAMDAAIEAFEKQMPKKPIAYDKSWNGTTVYKCPVCNGPLGTKSFNEEQNQIGCARCLSAIDWSDTE